MEEVPDASGEKNQVVCQRMIEKSLQNSPAVKFMIEALQKSGCPVTEKFFKSENCSIEAGGGFVPQIGISICSNHLQTVTQGEVDQILTHELVHAYDHCRAANLDWSDCQHHACSEIRAANLSGDCKWTLELLRGHTNIRQQQQVCVRRRAQLSVAMNPHCSEGDAKKAVDAVWKTCYEDTKPFDRAP
ncbi:unnamed protein product [Calypogeia fissa]